MTMTPERLRDWTILIRMEGYDYRKPSISDIEEQLHAHAAALEEIERLKKDRDEWKKDATTALGQINEEHIRANNAEYALAECRAKLEVDPRTKYDGIACRDETIRLQDEEIERLNKAWKAQQLHLEHEEKESELQAQRAERAESALADAKQESYAMRMDLERLLQGSYRTLDPQWQPIADRLAALAESERKIERLRACFERAIKNGWEMIDPLRPPPVGSYNLGHHNGVVDALRQVKANYEQLLRAEFKEE